MRAVGIIAEYNPLHNGHIYHMQEARRLAGCDAVVVALSGDYVQRGEPAILNKWERARLAVDNGADLVVEIPALYCLGNASQYALGGISVLESIPAVEKLAFGSETGDVKALKQIAGVMDLKNEEMELLIQHYSSQGMTYPAARARAFADITGEGIELNSNDILGVEYLRQCSRLEPVAVKRLGADYRDEEIGTYDFQSASAIRNALIKGESFLEYVPESTAEILNSERLTTPDLWLQTLKYAVLTTSDESIDDCPSGDRGIGSRIRNAVVSADTWEDFVLAVKSRNYTYSRISRLCLQIILGVSRSEFKFERCSYVRVLAMNDTGREILAEMRKTENGSHIITKLGREQNNLTLYEKSLLELDVRASDVYNLVAGYDIYSVSDYRMHPYVKKSR